MTLASAVDASVEAQHALPQGPCSGVFGRLQAVFSIRDVDALPGGDVSGLTVARVSTIGPLELRRPVVADDRFFLRNVTAGVFGGDAYEVALTCEAGANVSVESTSATKVYAMPGGGATSHVRLRAGAGSRLVWGPHSTILHADSDYSSSIDIDIAGGLGIVAETVVMGRLAAGEAFEFRRFYSELTVRDDAGTVLFAERASLVPSGTLRDAMVGRGALTTVYGLGMAVDEATAGRLTEATSRFDLAGWSVLPNGAGLVAKALVGSGSQGESFARECIGALR